MQKDSETPSNQPSPQISALWGRMGNPLSPLTLWLLLGVVLSFAYPIWLEREAPAVQPLLLLQSSENTLGLLEKSWGWGLIGFSFLCYEGLRRWRKRPFLAKPAWLAQAFLVALLAVIWTVPRIRPLDQLALAPPMAAFEVKVTAILPQERERGRTRNAPPQWSPYWHLQLEGPADWQDTLKIAVRTDSERRSCEWLAGVKVGEQLHLSLQAGALGGQRIALLTPVKADTQRPPCDFNGLR